MISRVALVWACCALVLAACSDSQEGGKLPPLPSAPPSASPTPSTSPNPGDPKAVLVALARQYYEESDKAIRSGNTTGLRALATNDCTCLDFADRIDADWRKGKVDAPNFFTVVDIRSPFFDGPNIGFVNVLYRTNLYQVADPSGKIISTLPPDSRTHSFTLELHRNGERWMVADVVRL